jgi:1-deoxy-D-xylulose-5-phosphate synthase
MARILDHIDSPADLKKLPIDELDPLASEIRQLILDVVSRNAGHLAPSLGAVELTIALHRVFDTPRDKLIWDVGHQGYVHKILTGRRERFPTIRKKDGLSGYLRRDESEYDEFGAGHASTSISAATGIATARDLNGEDFRVTAIIGDGSLTGGMAWEALNNIGADKLSILVILNDNNMSIHPNVGALSKSVNELITHDYYNRVKDEIWGILGKGSSVGRSLRGTIAQWDSAVKSLLVPGPNLIFEKLGIRYFGPVDGHDVRKVIETMEQVRDLPGPRLLHVLTQKGKGVPYAEKSPHIWHGVSKFDSESGVISKKQGPPSYTDVFGKTLSQQCDTRDNVVGITGAMAKGCGLNYLQESHPGRFFDVGIAEEHAVTFAAGLATRGIKPVVAIYSTFLQRAFDQIIHDVAIQKLPVAFVLDRGGLVGDDGATHNGIFDLSYLRMIPNVVVMAPKDETELQRMLVTMLDYDGPIAMRFPRDNGVGSELSDDPQPIEIGTWECLREGADVAILAIGSMVYPSMEVAETLATESLSCEVINARFVNPADQAMLRDIASRHSRIVTVEENVLKGGFGSGIMEELEALDLPDSPSVRRIGIPDRFTEHGTRKQVLEDVGLTTENIAAVVRKFAGVTRPVTVQAVS